MMSQVRLGAANTPTKPAQPVKPAPKSGSTMFNGGFLFSEKAPVAASVKSTKTGTEAVDTQRQSLFEKTSFGGAASRTETNKHVEDSDEE